MMLKILSLLFSACRDGPGRLIIRCLCQGNNLAPFRPIFFKLCWPRTRLASIFVGTCPNSRWFSDKFFHMWETWVYCRHISDYSSGILAPLYTLVPWAASRLACPLVWAVYVSFLSFGYMMNIKALWKHRMCEICGQILLDCVLLIEPDRHMSDTNIFIQIKFFA